MSAAPRLAIACRQVAGVTGTTTTILEHARRLCALGWAVEIFGESLERSKISALGAKPRRMPALPWGSTLKRRLFSWLFERAVRGKGFDLVWGHGDTLAQDVLSLHNCVHAAHEAVFGHGLPADSGVGRMHALILRERRFRLLIANSDMMRSEVLSRFGVPEDKVAVIRPGHDPARFSLRGRELGLPIRAQLGAGPEDVLVGVVTSGDFAKRGVAPFLSSLGRLSPAARARLRVVVIGQESRVGIYRKIAADAGLGERARFLPPVPEVERYFHALDVYVHPALYEEFGQSVQEAMACGVCVLTSARVGASELLRGPAREMLLPKPSEEGFAARLESLILDPDLRRRWAAAGPEACRDNTWDENFRQTLERLRPLLRRPGA